MKIAGLVLEPNTTYVIFKYINKDGIDKIGFTPYTNIHKAVMLDNYQPIVLCKGDEIYIGNIESIDISATPLPIQE